MTAPADPDQNDGSRHDRWSGVAQTFYASRAAAKRSPRRRRLLCRHYERVTEQLGLTPDWAVLDAGCGAGELGEAVRDRVRFYCGVDVSMPSLAVAREYSPDQFLVCADMAALPLRGVFDAVVAVTSLEFVCDKETVLRGFRRVLQDDGMLFVEVRNADFILLRLLTPVRVLFTKLGLLVPYPAFDFRDLRYAEWRALLTQAGFEIKNVCRSRRPIGFGSILTRIKNLAIALVGLGLPVKHHYMVSFVCRKASCHGSTVDAN